MGRKIDLLTGLAIVVVVGVIATSRYFPAIMDGGADHVPDSKASSAIYQVAFKSSRLVK